ncbi:MAG: lysozyme inhibitor LprI family protein [Pseudomonadota bacterium]
MKKIHLFTLLLATCAQLSCAASFDCAKASTATEKLICSDAKISALDEQLNAAYKAAIETATDKDAFKAQQRDWLKQKRNVCEDVDCLAKTYQSRITTLSAVEIPDDFVDHWIHADRNPEGYIIKKDSMVTPYYDGECRSKIIKVEKTKVEYVNSKTGKSELRDGYQIDLVTAQSKYCAAQKETIEIIPFYDPDVYDPKNEHRTTSLYFKKYSTQFFLHRGGSGKFNPDTYCDGGSTYSITMCSKMRFIKTEAEMRQELENVLARAKSLKDKESVKLDQAHWEATEGLPCPDRADSPEGGMTQSNDIYCTTKKYLSRIEYLKKLFN